MYKVEKERLSKKLNFPWWIKKEHRARYKFASSFIKNSIVTDCACGTGEGAYLFSQKAKEVIAIDLSENALQEATSRFQNKNLVFKMGNALDIPVSDSFADIYISLETIEHIENDCLYLQEAIRILKSHGIFICSTPNRIVTNPGKALSEKPCNPFHIREYSPRDFSDLLKRYFSKIELYGLNRNGLFKVKLLVFFGKLFPWNIATRLHQSLKLFKFFLKTDSKYQIEKILPDYNYEYPIAVCRK